MQPEDAHVEARDSRLSDLQIGGGEACKRAESPSSERQLLAGCVIGSGSGKTLGLKLPREALCVSAGVGALMDGVFGEASPLVDGVAGDVGDFKNGDVLGDIETSFRLRGDAEAPFLLDGDAETPFPSGEPSMTLGATTWDTLCISKRPRTGTGAHSELGRIIDKPPSTKRIGAASKQKTTVGLCNENRAQPSFRKPTEAQPTARLPCTKN